MGANAVVDGRKDDVLLAASRFAPNGLDAALITAGGDTAERSLRAIKRAYRVASPGTHADESAWCRRRIAPPQQGARSHHAHRVAPAWAVPATRGAQYE
ncbi:hypothetical protein ACLMAJ_03690 [Nocardia sp. KC 131]|uniref:hypothetical protein n=1 Tax=Nocardia arseniciresistens TaxID=3392119 RepID=UPI00398E7D53